jgi:hypothetical protein
MWMNHKRIFHFYFQIFVTRIFKYPLPHCWMQAEYHRHSRIRLYTQKPIIKYRMCINYRSILQNHIFTNIKQKYMMLLPFERGMFAVS